LSWGFLGVFWPAGMLTPQAFGWSWAVLAFPALLRDPTSWCPGPPGPGQGPGGRRRRREASLTRAPASRGSAGCGNGAAGLVAPPGCDVRAVLLCLLQGSGAPPARQRGWLQLSLRVSPARAGVHEASVSQGRVGQSGGRPRRRGARRLPRCRPAGGASQSRGRGRGRAGIGSGSGRPAACRRSG
jgi:hypothetical protein